MTFTISARWLWVGALASGAFLIGAVVGFSVDHGIWTEVTAAWVQAIGSVAAIVAAIQISQGEARRARQERQEEVDRRHRECRQGIVRGLEVLRDFVAAVGPHAPPDAMIIVSEWVRRIDAIGQSMSFCAEHLAVTGLDHAKTMAARIELSWFRGELGRRIEDLRADNLQMRRLDAQGVIGRIEQLLSEFDAGAL